MPDGFFNWQKMEAERIENIQSLTTILIWVTTIIFAYGFAYHKQAIMLAGMFGLGLTLVVHAPLSFAAIRQWRERDVKTRLAFWGESFFAGGQFLFGVFALLGAVADLTTSYLTSGRFWQQVSQYPFLFLFVFGTFCSLVGIFQIFTNLKPEGDKLSDKLGSLKEIIEGNLFLVFGLFFIGLIIFVILL